MIVPPLVKLALQYIQDIRNFSEFIGFPLGANHVLIRNGGSCCHPTVNVKEQRWMPNELLTNTNRLST